MLCNVNQFSELPQGEMQNLLVENKLREHVEEKNVFVKDTMTKRNFGENYNCKYSLTVRECNF